MSYGYPRLRAFSAVAVVVVLLLSLPFASDARGESAEEMTQQAVKLFKKGDYTKAAPLFRKAAEQGNAKAQLGLGLLYLKGKGIRQDDKKAAEWYRKAAEQGNGIAFNNLAFMYFNGYGVKKDILTVYALLLLSAKEGSEEARAATNKMKQTLTTEQVTAGQRIAREWEQRIEANKQKKQ